MSEATGQQDLMKVLSLINQSMFTNQSESYRLNTRLEFYAILFNLTPLKSLSFNHSLHFSMADPRASLFIESRTIQLMKKYSQTFYDSRQTELLARLANVFRSLDDHWKLALKILLFVVLVYSGSKFTFWLILLNLPGRLTNTYNNRQSRALNRSTRDPTTSTPVINSPTGQLADRSVSPKGRAVNGNEYTFSSSLASDMPVSYSANEAAFTHLLNWLFFHDTKSQSTARGFRSSFAFTINQIASNYNQQSKVS